MGTVLIGIGIGMESLKTLKGADAVLAGIGLVALGTILKAFSGGGADTPAGGPASVTGDTTETAEETFPEELEKQTAVTVNVEGTVLDPVAVGESIVAVLQEAFDTTGSQVVTNVG